MKTITLEEMKKRKTEQDKINILVTLFSSPKRFWGQLHCKHRMRKDIKKRTLLYNIEHKEGEKWMRY